MTDYQSFIEDSTALLGTMGEKMSSAESVAEEIFNAATDGSNQFRYAVGADAQEWIKNRTSMDDLTFSAHMRNMFKPN